MRLKWYILNIIFMRFSLNFRIVSHTLQWISNESETIFIWHHIITDTAKVNDQPLLSFSILKTIREVFTVRCLAIYQIPFLYFLTKFFK